MTIKYVEEYRDQAVAGKLAEEIRRLSRRPVRLMEVCGTHTMSIFRNGIRSLLPETITLLSGPGCPVCVTDQGEIDAFVMLSRRPEVIIATFGDLMRVPGSGSSLQKEKAAGADIRVVYSAYDALEIAKDHPDRTVVFLGVGFETTAPTIAATLLTARGMGLENFTVYSAHKRVPPALFALAESRDIRLNGLLLPGHVSVIIGLEGYRPFFDAHHIPSVVAGFEPADILQGIRALTAQIESETPRLENAYPRAVTEKGNGKAREVMAAVFEVVDTRWRGLGEIPASGLAVLEKYKEFDAAVRFGLAPPDAQAPKGCACGEILTGVKTPPQCALYKKACTPMAPVGPCMVSSEGTCAAYYRYHNP